ncbi:MAG: fatty acid desaturase family protein [Bacteroidota bacterium]
MQTPDKITFLNTRKDFTITLNKRVNNYFKQNKISRFANREMVIKTIVMMALYFGPYALILSGAISGTFITIVMTILMGLGLAGIGLSVMHDGNHGAYAGKHWINSTIGYSLNLIGANSFNWKIQHNVLHHSYTNIYHADEDISVQRALRLSPNARWRWFHQYQAIYAWFLYGLMTLFWMFYKDFEQLWRYQKNGLLRKQKGDPAKEWAILLTTKLIYVGYIFVAPILLTSWLWWQVLIGIVIMHFVTGFLLAIIFQPAHVIVGSEFPLPDKDRSMKDNWAIHQLRTTTNFANSSRWFTWLVGGLNFQIEHHLFPGICHVHYRQISKVVKSTAREFGLPYKTVSTFSGALSGHLRLLRKLGMKRQGKLHIS